MQTNFFLFSFSLFALEIAIMRRMFGSISPSATMKAENGLKAKLKSYHYIWNK